MKSIINGLLLSIAILEASSAFCSADGFPFFGRALLAFPLTQGVNPPPAGAPTLQTANHFNELDQHTIDAAMHFVANAMDGSASGQIWNIHRAGYPDYLFDPNTLKALRTLIFLTDRQLYESALEIAFRHRAADCWHQGLYLALMLKHTRAFYERFAVFLATTEVPMATERATHAFVVVVPRNAHFLAEHQDELQIPVTLRELMLNENLVAIDPWQFRIFEDFGTTLTNHPLRYLEQHGEFVDLDTELGLMNLDHTFLEIADQFQDLHRRITIREILRRFPTLPPLLATPLNEGDFNLVLRRACTHPKWIELVRFLLDHAALIGLDPLEAKTSGNALEIAIAKANDQAVELLKTHPFSKSLFL